jgi:adenylylsulfate kinase
MISKKIEVLLLTGPTGVGKTSVAHGIADILEERSVSHAVIDLDALRYAFPRPEKDPFNMEIGYKNLTSIWQNYREYGVTHVIIPNVVERNEDIKKIKQIISNSHISLIRLTASLDTIHNRLKKREEGDSLQWHIDRATQLHQELRDSSLEDLAVETEGKSVREVVSEIILKLKWN